MHALRKLKTLVVAGDSDLETLAAQLEQSGVPVTLDDCRTCADPCEDHESFPSRFDVDLESKLLGVIKPWRRLIIITTGKSDWNHEITDVSHSLAAYVLHARDKANVPDGHAQPVIKGVYASKDVGQVTILNGSLTSLDHEHEAESVLVLPDYKVVVRVKETQEGANTLWKHVLSPEAGRASFEGPESGLESYVLPYSFVISICSHTRRDKRCGIAAPILEREFIRVLQSKGWHTHTSLEDPSHEWSSSIEKLEGNQEEKERAIIEQLKTLREKQSVLLLTSSHVGGHKFVGNVQIHTPQGSCVWYGRVTPHEVEAIVSNTLIEGKILPTLLRGGIDIARPNCRSLSDW